jgi:glycosyltransferase involved in cell wall biosynthesis
MRPTIAPPPSPGLRPGPVPTFSVIIAAYQAAAFVANAVASALEQTAPAHEVIVCDDGSTDDIEGALEPYLDQITLLRREHRGRSAAKNSAAFAASGEFVALLDADDLYLPERLEAIGELASSRPDLDIITTDAYLEVDGRPLRRCYEEDKVFDVADQRRALLEHNFIFSAAAVRRSRLAEVGGFDEAIVSSEDWDCWLRLVFSGSLVGLVNEPLYRYHMHEDAISSDKLLTSRGQVQTAEKAARTLELTPGERALVQRLLAERRATAELERARAALLGGAPDARQRSLAIVKQRGHGLRTRAKAAFGAAAPGTMRRLLQARERRTWVTASGARVSRPADERK